MGNFFITDPLLTNHVWAGSIVGAVVMVVHATTKKALLPVLQEGLLVLGTVLMALLFLLTKVFLLFTISERSGKFMNLRLIGPITISSYLLYNIGQRVCHPEIPT